MMTDRALGTLLLACNSSFFIYYVLWIGVMPFVDESHFTQALFLPREYGLLLAALIMTTAIGVGMFVGSLHTIWRTGYVPPSSRTSMGTEATLLASGATTDRVAPDVTMAAK
ncbi:Dolichol phosphate-mannose biosynthesis regulatory protein (DPM2) [Leishmania donovani]|uniref:Dolichol phosphate-mannose biosynthesis regulatory protein n=3 Tax=Leishmania donovani species complex TaxID=38574 RepID=A0A6L0WY09_LEIIN|nr:conserved hypothetical protein [Leishmania infantum JPCM5]XP_003859610.1 hypothetical protein, conserved [Leishmania donovani]CAC9472488.1 Dolichol_phosphate-mannose_biosynthesis_regulatory_protein_(DPM2)_-_putative [Leishmania infantum]AYU77500.1 Dolichol phosphate-mannose biosynthesis regulatory protein (DPM2), putative [Leishmania donovani]TPP47726.1 Dolichol phosphate-mannose biosynthesis regulatory protein (DPM2) family protein [Leishmania donovani]TPP53158.1 Dolichol phosphate-mannose|eukprot:XP_001464419.1 conserved hypothetical protein [Leishmania infantum JPCM5]